MSKYTQFVKEILNPPANCADEESMTAAFDYAAAVIDKHFNDDTLRNISFETGGHNGLKEVMTIGELNDHFNTGSVPWDHPYSFTSVRNSLQSAAAMIISSAAGKDNSMKFTPERVESMFLSAHRFSLVECGCCGNQPRTIIDLVKGEAKIQGDENQMSCPGKNLTPETFEFTAPSGNLVAANDLRSIIPAERLEYNTPEHTAYRNLKTTYFRKRGVPYASINSVLGQRANRDFYLQEHGLVYLQAGNSSPDIYAGDGFLQIGRNYDYELDKPLDNEDMKSVANICTDVWAVNLMDYELFCKYVIEMGKEPEEVLEDLGAIILDVPETTMAITDHYTVYDIADEPDVVARINFHPELQAGVSSKPGM